MSNYTNYIKDFPSRCQDILKRYEKQSNLLGREVTLMLAIATSGFIIPLERLKPGSEHSHPSRDRDKHRDAQKEFDKLWDSKFCGSRIWGKDPGSWKCGILESIEGIPDSWEELNKNPKTISPDKTVRNTFKTMRNALAHGNILTRGNPIDAIIFLSQRCEESSEYNYISVSPQDFRKFLNNWFNFFGTLTVRDDVIPDDTIHSISFGD